MGLISSGEMSVYCSVGPKFNCFSENCSSIRLAMGHLDSVNLAIFANIHVGIVLYEAMHICEYNLAGNIKKLK